MDSLVARNSTASIFTLSFSTEGLRARHASMILATSFIALVVAVGVALLLREMRHRHRDSTVLKLIGIFGPSIARVQVEPRELPAWAGVARSARRVFPEAFSRLDAAGRGSFPFSSQFIEGAHARWTAVWLAWEREHDLTYKRLASEVEVELAQASSEQARLLEARFGEIEQEKLQRYQERYEEYVRIGKAFAALEQSSGDAR